MPQSPGIVVVHTPSGPQLTGNICHPLQSFDRASEEEVTSGQPVQTIRPILRSLGRACEQKASKTSELKFATDTPTPKTLA